jgi:CheY-like chemotaxis protein
MYEVLAGKRVLVVEDEPDVWKLVRFELSKCVVDYAATYDEARARLAEGKHDLAIIDIMGVKGFSLLEEFGKALPCIILTARALTEKDLERAIAAGAVLYLPKHEIGCMDECAAKVLDGQRPLWGWLFRRIDFKRWFGASFEPPVLKDAAPPAA